MRTLTTRLAPALLAVLLGSTLLAASPGALAPGEVRYVVTLTARAHTPDVTALGGRVELEDGSAVTVVLPAQAAKALAGDPAVQTMREAVPSPQPATGIASSHHVTNEHFRLTPQDAITLWGSGEYVYDGAGNITAMGTASALNGDGKTSTFTYDLASRLQGALIGRASGGDIKESYTYDGFGNLTKHQRDTPGTPVIYSPLPNLTNNRMTESGVSYDSAGNVTALASQTLTYDAFNQVTSKYATVTPPPATPDYTYIYDVNEERIGIQQGSATTHWTIRDFDNKPLVAFDSPPASTTQQTQWTWVESFAWAGGTILMAERPMVGPLHYHVDHLGSTRAITDANGQLVAGSRVDYAPFGEEITTPNAEVIKFTGHERDYDLSNPTADTYLDYMHARYYDSRRGRFLSVDPERDLSKSVVWPQRWDRYTYARNNPIARIDPDGLRDIYVAIWTARQPYFLWGSVGHAAAYEMNGSTILSQFPEPHGKHGHNVSKDWAHTLKAEGRGPASIFKVFVPNDKAFDAAAAMEQTMHWWDWYPDAKKSQTNCSTAVACALKAGGVPVEVNKYEAIPDDLLDWLMNASKRKPGANQAWSVTSVPEDTLSGLNNRRVSDFFGVSTGLAFDGAVWIDGVRLK